MLGQTGDNGGKEPCPPPKFLRINKMLDYFIDTCSVQLLVSIIMSNLNFHNNQATNFFHLINFLPIKKISYINQKFEDKGLKVTH